MAQKKIPLLGLDSWFFEGRRGKKFPGRIAGNAVILLTDALFWRGKTTEGEIMRKIVAGLLLISCCGCSGGVYTPLGEAEIRLGSPMYGDGQRVPVVYPGRSGVSDDPMVQAFGPSWRSMENDYPAYNFNP